MEGKRLRPHCDHDFNQLKDISWQINFLINLQNNEEAQRQFYMNQKIMQEIQQKQYYQIKIRFKFTNGLIKDLFVDPDTTIQQLNNKLSEAIQNDSLSQKFDYILLFNAKKIDKNDQTKVKDYFTNKNNISIIVNCIYS